VSQRTHDPSVEENDAQQENYDLIITDLMMPGANGLQVLKELSKDGYRLSETIRKLLIKQLHAEHEPIYQQIYEVNRRRNAKLLASYYARQQAQQEQKTNAHSV
jgi:CheY-like chemotaxis protein